MAESKKEVRQSFLNKARADKFQMTIPLPPILKDRASRSVRSTEYVSPDALDFSIYKVTMPKIASSTIDVKYGGQTLRETGWTREPYDPVQIGFVIDNEFSNYWMLYKWLNIVHDNREGMVVDPTGRQDLEGITTTITIVGIDEYNKPKINFKFHRAVPVSLNEFVFDYQEPKEIESGFEFRFHQLEVNIL